MQRIFLDDTHIISKFRESPSSGNRVFTCEQRDMKKLLATLRKFTNAPKM